MPPAAVPVTLTAAEHKTLKKRVRGAQTCWRDRLRALVVLAAARGRVTARIAADLGISVDTVRKWRGRFAERGLAGLADLPRAGRPREISEADRAAVVALACQLPAATGVPLSRWTGPELAREPRKIHRRRPHRPAPPHQPTPAARRRPPGRPGDCCLTPDELTVSPT